MQHWALGFSLARSWPSCALMDYLWELFAWLSVILHNSQINKFFFIAVMGLAE